MATISQPAPLAGDSLLEKLPPELLEKILLEVVNGVVSPSGYTGKRYDRLRCNTEATQGFSMAPLLLKHRLVSRTIRMSSWRSLTKVLGETIFDMCSKESMANLVALTSCANLAPWMNKLTVSCFKVSKTYPRIYSDIQDDNDDDDDAFANRNGVCQNELSRVRDLDVKWYDYAWASPMVGGDISTEDMYQAGINPGFQKVLKKMFSACLACLVNLDNVCYFYHGYHVPARFREFEHRYRSVGVFKFGVAAHDNQTGADLGFRLLMDIMAIAKLQPKRLCLAVYLANPQYFWTSSWTSLKCLRRVEELTLTDPGNVPRVWKTSTASISAIAISKTTFPNLRSFSMEIDCFPDVSSINNQLLPQVLDLPELRHVSIAGGRQSCPNILEFLDLLKGTVQSVSLRNMEDVSYEPILKVLRSLKLDVLAIHDGYDQWWVGDTYDEREFRGVPKGLLESIAKNVTFGPLEPDF
jgi:hypothetical protein